MNLTPERWQEVLRLHEAASALPAAEREAFLARECEDPEILAEVRRMLAAPSSDDFLEPPPLDEPVSGRDLGDFTLLEEIGRGGMGVVYRALQRPLQRIVAVKVLPATFALTQRQIDRFVREARSAARLSHPNLVAVLTVGEERGVRYFAMEYVDGHNLADELKRLRANLGTDEHDRAHLPSSHASDFFRSIAECVRQAADGLAYAHEHRVIHRDVKPSNLLLDSAGRIKLVDFGLARDEELGTLSASGDVVGTPHYMSPEQARAHRHQIDHRTDIYSLGVVLYELLTLVRPFEGKTSQEVIDNLLRRDAVAVRKLNPRVPRDLATICTKAMARDPRDRYLDAGAMRDDLERFLAHEAIVARPPGVLEILSGRVQRHRVPLVVAGVAIGATLGGLFFQAARNRENARLANLEAIRSARAEGALEDLVLSRQIDLRRRLGELAGDRADHVAEESNDVTALRRAFESFKREEREKALADLALSRDAAQAEDVRMERRLTALLTFAHLSQLFPEDDELHRLASIETAFPTLAVEAKDERGAATSADVFLRRVDVFTSALERAQRLGSTPLPPTAVSPGYYRVVVVFAEGGFGELICSPGPAFMETRLVASRRRDEGSITNAMVAFPACSYTFPDLGDELYHGRSLELTAYWIDATEVSNAEYHRFVQDTGRRLPRFWYLEPDLAGFLARHGDLPVVGVCWNDAVAFAEWAGKRLPTTAEWLRAAAGTEGRAFPYSADLDAAPRGNVFAPSLTSKSNSEQWNEYLTRAAPVRSHPDAATPEGLFHMFGNVSEYVESLAVTTETADLLVPRAFDRFFIGASWEALANREDLYSFGYDGTGPTHAHSYMGFRCARSSAP